MGSVDLDFRGYLSLLWIYYWLIDVVMILGVDLRGYLDNVRDC